MKKDSLLMAAAAVCFAVMLFSLWQVVPKLTEYYKSAQEYGELRDYVSYPDDSEVPAGTENTGAAAPGPGAAGIAGTDPSAAAVEGQPETDALASLPYPVPAFPRVDFSALKSINPDITGWITCPGTRIDYPVVKGEDNDKYLHRSFEGKYNAGGSIFMEAANSPVLTDDNTILYGHHMRDGSMFRDLAKYKEEGFYAEHPYFLYITPDGNYLGQIFAGCLSDASGDGWKLSFAAPEEKTEWLAARVRTSVFETDVTPSAADRIMTLSTCSYEFGNARFVLYGILIKVP